MRGILIALTFCFLSLNLYDHNLTDYSTRNPAELHCLAMNIYFEARGEPKKGQIVVGQVTINRKRNKAFPKSICAVVMQPFQFSWVKQVANWHKTKIPEEIYAMADDLMAGKYKDESRGALYFHAKEVDPFDRREVLRIGNHIFYR